MSEIDYIGDELQLFAQATHWKRYWSSRVAPHVRGRVLDVGAGLGATIDALSNQVDCRWTALEPDAGLAAAMRDRFATRAPVIDVINGTLADLDPQQRFDTILYIDVLEHIEGDRAELQAAARHLAPGGRLVVLAPAHAWLYTPFDAAIGHVRRYTRASLTATLPSSLQLRSTFYLDSVGMFASLANRLLLRARMPTLAQIRVWDRLMVPLSRIVDPLLLRHVGKTVVMVGEHAGG